MGLFRFKRKDKKNLETNSDEGTSAIQADAVVDEEIDSDNRIIRETTIIDESSDKGIEIVKATPCIQNETASNEETKEKKYTSPPRDLLCDEKPDEVKVPIGNLLDALDEKEDYATKLPVILGKDGREQAVLANLVDMPHLLIVGVSDSGKTVCMDSIITSLLVSQSPENIRMVLINPSGVGLMSYCGIPHLLFPPITEYAKVEGALNWLISTARDRYQMIQQSGARDFEGYNDIVKTIEYSEEEKERLSPMERIIVMIDELGDIILHNGKEFEETYQEAIQRGRGAGIHFVATTNPLSGVMGQRLYASFPSKIACALTSGEDSRQVLNMRGAERLLGRGDMLYLPMHFSAPVRLQGAYVSDNSIKKLVEFLINNTEGYSCSEQTIKSTHWRDNGCGEDNYPDELLAEAGRLIIEKDKATIGMLQRAFRIGFNRAARIMDQLGDAGVVGEEEGTKPRRILMDRMQFEEYIDNYL